MIITKKQGNPVLDPRIVKWGEAYDNIRDNPNFKILEEMEEAVKTELALELSSLPPNTENYTETMAYHSGIIEGIKKISSYRKECRENYKQTEKEMVNVNQEQTGDEPIY